jgi:flagellar biosynthesis protein FlhF
VPADNPAELRGQIAELQKMMGQVLESTRRTSVAMGKVDPRAAEAVEAGPLLKYTTQLVDNDTPMATVDAIIARVRDRLDAAELRDEVVVRQAVLREIEATIDTRSDSLLAISAGATSGRPRVICLVGPTGVGKTTTVAKLAATCKLRHARRVGLITSDTYRIAAVEQLRTYAGIIGLPLKVANTPAEMTQAIADLSAMDVIIVDTAGRSQHDARRLDELKAFITAAAPDETHLVLASTVGETVLQRTADRFKPLGPDRCILTKLDEAVCTGQIAGLTGRIGLPLSFVTVGQEVPDDIEPARADRLARVALDGPGVLCKGSDGRG